MVLINVKMSNYYLIYLNIKQPHIKHIDLMALKFSMRIIILKAIQYTQYFNEE